MLPEDYDERVLDVVRLIPPGRVMSYGDIAEYLGMGGPRRVGQALARTYDEVPWWRVIHADGSPPPHKDQRCMAHWRDEGTPLRPAGDRVDMRQARWDGGVAGAG